MFSNVEKECIRHGLDPYIGLLHVPRSGRRSLVPDLMEPFRPVLVDYVAIKAFKYNQISEEYFDQSHSSCFLTTSGKKACVQLIQEQGKKESAILTTKNGLFQEIKRLVQQLYQVVRKKGKKFTPPLWKD